MKRVACLVALALLCTAATASADDVIFKGIDTFTTTTDGSTHYSFANNPIPAGFFCKGSAPFSGEVSLKGLPLVASKPIGIGDGVDTIVERLDDAEFDKNGVATTRVKMGALSLVSIAPLETACGAFNVYISLQPEQRLTTMHIYRDYPTGGTFVAPLAVDARMRFVPVGGDSARALEMTGSFNLGSPRRAWSEPARGWHGEVEAVTVDTNGDGTPDRFFAGTSNFAAGYPGRDAVGRAIGGCYNTYCHDDGEGGLHCVQVCCDCWLPI